MSDLGYNLEDLANPATQIIRVIRNEIYNNTTTAFLAEVSLVKTNSAGKAVVDVKLLNTGVYNGETLKAQEVKSLLVGIPGVKKWLFNIPIQKGDIGLCIACKWDISGYGETGKGGEPKTTRTYNIGDSIFIPLSMYLQPEITEDLILTETGGHFKASVTSEGALDIHNDKFTLKVDKNGGITVNNEKTTVEIKDDGAVTITANGSVTIDAKTNDCSIKCNKAVIDGTSIELGKGATSPVPLGDILLEKINAALTLIKTHTHKSVDLGKEIAPSSELSTMLNIPDSVNSTTSKTL